MEFKKDYSMISSTSPRKEYEEVLLNFSTGDIEREWFYGETNMSDKELPTPHKKVILKILDDKVFGIADKKLPSKK